MANEKKPLRITRRAYYEDGKPWMVLKMNNEGEYHPKGKPYNIRQLYSFLRDHLDEVDFDSLKTIQLCGEEIGHFEEENEEKKMAWVVEKIQAFRKKLEQEQRQASGLETLAESPEQQRQEQKEEAAVHQ